MLRMEDVRRRYPELDLAVDFSVERGELVSILGPSGSGKTTTLRLVAGFERPETGRVVLEGRDVTSLPAEQRRVGFVFQDYTLFPHMDVERNVSYALRVRGATRAEMSRAASRYLDLVGLDGYQRRDVQTLSGGEQQRVAIARALASAPLLLLLDEPFSSIDTILRRDLRRQLLDLQKELGITLLFVTHNQEEALAISDRVIVMRRGGIAQVGAPDELYLRPASRFVASFVGEASFFPGAVERVEPESGEVRIRSFRLLEVAPQSIRPRPGSATVVMVRPTRLRLVSRGDARPNSFPVRVVEHEYYGHQHAYVCVVDVAGADALRVVVYDGERRGVGEELAAWFRPEDGVLLAGEGEDREEG